jgi:hypothetical protein
MIATTGSLSAIGAITKSTGWIQTWSGGIELRDIASILYAGQLHDTDFQARTARFYAR